jgi:hypothetical protein
MKAEHALFLALFSLLAAGGTMIWRRAMSVTSLYDTSTPARANSQAPSAHILAYGLAMAILSVSVIALIAWLAIGLLKSLLIDLGMNVPIEISFRGLHVSADGFLKPPDELPHVAMICTVLFGVLAVALRNSAGFVFFSFHTALAGLCVVVDFVVASPVAGRAAITMWMLNVAFYMVMASQCFFVVFFARRTLHQAVVAVACAALSGLTFAICTVALSTLATIVDETSFMLMIYLILAYGITASHVAALSMSLAYR